jgi:hypothetical protein
MNLSALVACATRQHQSISRHRVLEPDTYRIHPVLSGTPAGPLLEYTHRVMVNPNAIVRIIEGVDHIPVANTKIEDSCLAVTVATRHARLRSASAMPAICPTREMMTRVCMECGEFNPGRFPKGSGEKQHLNAAGPGHSPDSVEPTQLKAHTQRPLIAPQLGLVQHLMSAGVPGQAPEMKLPPPFVHAVVVIQTPGSPPAPVQGSPMAADNTCCFALTLPSPTPSHPHHSYPPCSGATQALLRK